MAINATWVWIREDRPLDPTRAARFAREHGVRTAWVSVPWRGPDESILRMVAALRAEGLAVAALGGTTDWAEHPHQAAEWAGRAMAGQVFASVHLDIEPWTLPQWPTDADRLLTGTAAAIRLVGQITDSRVEVDLAPHVAQTHPDGFAAVARAAGAVTVMSYRASTAAILDVAAPAVRVLEGLGRSYRLAVDTLPSPDPDSTFAGRPLAYLQRVTTEVSAQLSRDPHFLGFAVHDLRGWLDLPGEGTQDVDT